AGRDVVAAVRLVALAVAAQVDGDDLQPSGQQRRNQVPGARRRGKTVEQDDGRSLIGPDADVESEVANANRLIARRDGRFHGRNLCRTDPAPDTRLAKPTRAGTVNLILPGAVGPRKGNATSISSSASPRPRCRPTH